MRQLKRFIKRLVLWTLDLLGLHLFARYFQKSPMVLFWHGVSNHPNLDVEGESFPVKLFERQIKYIASHYEVISMDEFAKRYTEKCFTKREVVITFDDGYRDNLTIAAPILKKYSLPFTVFISAHNVDAQERFYISIPRLVIIGGNMEYVEIPSMNYFKELHTLSDRIECAHELEYTIKYFSHEKAKYISNELVRTYGYDNFVKLCNKYNNGTLLTWDDVKMLSDNYGCTIGSHCYDHCICHSNQNKAVIAKQIIDSRKLIEEKTGIKCNYFAYPNGDYTSYSDLIVEKYYKLGFSTKEVSVYDSTTTQSSIGRIGVPCSFEEFKFFLSRFCLTIR